MKDEIVEVCGTLNHFHFNQVSSKWWSLKPVLRVKNCGEGCVEFFVKKSEEPRGYGISKG